jgi:hypothetical protein
MSEEFLGFVHNMVKDICEYEYAYIIDILYDELSVQEHLELIGKVFKKEKVLID